MNGNLSIMGYTEITFKVVENTRNVSVHMADIVTKNETIKVNPLVLILLINSISNIALRFIVNAPHG